MELEEKKREKKRGLIMESDRGGTKRKRRWILQIHERFLVR